MYLFRVQIRLFVAFYAGHEGRVVFLLKIIKTLYHKIPSRVFFMLVSQVLDGH